jgi:multiple sugar transport system permease protein
MAAPAQKPRKRSRWGGLRSRELRMAMSIVIPALAAYALFRFYPILQTLVLSLTNAQLMRPAYQFVGLTNFAELAGDPLFLKVLGNTLVYALATTALGTALALGLAFLINPINRGGGVLRLIYFLPSITSVVAIAAIWQWMYQPRFGLFNQILAMAGLAPIPWLTSTQWAMPSLIIMALWAGVGYSALIFVAGLKGIPHAFAEAALIDGATPRQVNWHIRMPLLSRVISFVVVTGFVGSFQAFQQAYVMTRGGPLDATRFIALLIYDTTFERLRIGEAAAISFVLLVIVAAFTVLQLRLQRTDWEY